MPRIECREQCSGLLIEQRFGVHGDLGMAKSDEIAIRSNHCGLSTRRRLYFDFRGMTPPPRSQIKHVHPKATDAASPTKSYATAVLASKARRVSWRLHGPSRIKRRKTSADTTTRNTKTGSSPLSRIRCNELCRRSSQIHVVGLGQHLQRERGFGNGICPPIRGPMTAYLFSRSVDGMEGALGENLGRGARISRPRPN